MESSRYILINPLSTGDANSRPDILWFEWLDKMRSCYYLAIRIVWVFSLRIFIRLNYPCLPMVISCSLIFLAFSISYKWVWILANVIWFLDKEPLLSKECFLLQKSCKNTIHSKDSDELIMFDKQHKVRFSLIRLQRT